MPPEPSPEEPPRDTERDRLADEVRLRGERHRRFTKEGEPAVARRLAQIGILGWIIVVPALLGLFGGRWLDRLFGTGLTITGALLMIGLCMGCWSAWKWMNQP